MSRKYKFRNPDGLYFVTFATVNWIDVFTRRCYKDLLVESLNYCIDKKGLEVFAWVVMSNHVHLLVKRDKEVLEDVIRDFKKFTAKSILKEIIDQQQESRKEWMLWMFERAGKRNSNNSKYQFWQQHNQPIELITNESIENTIEYIHNNPVKAGYVDHPEDYPYSSAVDFAGSKGLITVQSI